MFDNNISVNTNTPINDNNLGKQKTKIEQILPFDVIDPTKVTRVGKQDNSGAAKNELGKNADSVFDKFLQALKNSPELLEGGRKIILNKQFINHNIKTDPALKTLFETFVKSIEMNDQEILDFLKFQQNTSTKFHGEFFDSLRTILKNNPRNEDFKIILREFLKSYDCFASVNETYSSISSVLKNIKSVLPEVLHQAFDELTSKLLPENTSNSLDFNLGVLKNDIIPFMGRYVSKMNDFGIIRDYVSVLVHSIVRLEAGTKENFSTDLDNLFDYIKYNFNLADDELETFKMLLINNYKENSDVKNNAIDSFLKLIESGIKDSDNVVNKGVMEDITQSLLFNQNVHLPLTHMFLPLNYNGVFMFSELWMGKVEEQSEDKKNRYESKEAYKLFITFDIQSIGYFETVIISRESNLSLEIFVPSSMKPFLGKIKKDIGSILSNKNLSVSNFFVNECIKKRKFHEVFNTITERKSGVNVII